MSEKVYMTCKSPRLLVPMHAPHAYIVQCTYRSIYSYFKKVAEDFVALCIYTHVHVPSLKCIVDQSYVNNVSMHIQKKNAGSMLQRQNLGKFPESILYMAFR